LEALVLMLAPFSPHVAEEMWEKLGHAGGLLKSARWPQADPELARQEELEIPIQVNGKLRSRLLAAPNYGRRTADCGAQRREDSRLHRRARGGQGHRCARRLVNIVIK